MTTTQNFPACVQFLNDTVSDETIGVQIQVVDAEKFETILQAVKNTPFDTVGIYPYRKAADLLGAFSVKVLRKDECFEYIKNRLKQDGYDISDIEEMDDIYEFHYDVLSDEYGIYTTIVDGDLADFTGIKINTPWRDDNDNFVLYTEFTNQSKYGSVFEAGYGTMLRELTA